MLFRYSPSFILLFFISCHYVDEPQKEKILPANTVAVKMVAKDSGDAAQLQETFLKKLIPVQGYRFIIKGDFNGDGVQETITEHYFSRKEGKETAKFYEGVEYDKQVDLTGAKDPYSFVSCSNRAIKNLLITDQPQLLGLSYLKNEGDLDGDGGDEISYVVDWADWSSINTCYVMTYKNKQWKQILSFAIRDWQLPDLPQSSNSYGMFGLQEREAIPADEKEQNLQAEKELKAFSGFIQKISNNRIKVAHIGNDAEEKITIINLKKVKRIPGF